MTYALGVDLGTTWSAAAVARKGRATIVELGTRTAAMPSVVFLTTDGQMLTGEAANRRGVLTPDRVAREFKRRIGSETSLIIGGSPASAESLTARLLRAIVATVTEIEGEPPTTIAVTHPANWGEYKLDLQRQAFRMAGLNNVEELTEPEAAAMHYASLEHTPEGSPIGVFDLGGGTFDAAILRKHAEGFEILGSPDGVERLGGIDFDEAVFAHVVRSLGGKFEELDHTDPAVVGAVSRLRSECVAAKEALSKDTDVAIPVVLPSVQTEVRMTRSEFEAMIRPSLADAVDALERAAQSAGLEIADLHRVLLVGGSSRIPLVGQILGGEMGLPIVINAHPKNAVALGAALAAEAALPAAEPAAFLATPHPDTAEPEITPPDVASSTPDATTTPISASGATPIPASGATPIAGETTTTARFDDATKSQLIKVGALAVLVVALAVAVAVLLTTGNNDGQAVGAGAAQADEAPTATASPAAEPTATEVSPTPTTVPPTAVPPTAVPPTEVPVFACPGGLCAHIESATSQNGELVIEWTAFGFTPSVANFHAHFFYDIYEPEQVGTNFAQLGALTQGDWELTDAQPFSTAGTAVSVANAPAAATAICVVAADSGHGVANPENAECTPIP